MIRDMNMNKARVAKRTAILITMAMLTAILYSVTGGLLTIRSFEKGPFFQYKFFHNQKNVSLSSNVPEGKWDVLVSTYMRSGSTFVGKLLGWRQDSFYWYEPLWKIHTWGYLREDGQHCHYLKTTCSNNGTTAVDAELTFLSDVYNCNFTKHSNKVKEGLHTKFIFSGHSWEIFSKCRKNGKTMIKECLSRLEAVCRNATHRVTKVLRLDVLLTTRLLEKHPRLKVVLLLRDPRAVINSHVHTSWFPIKANDPKLRGDIQVLCSRMDRDIEAIKKLQVQYGNRVRIIQYEDFDDPVEKALILYRFVGMDVKKTDTKLLRNLTKVNQTMIQQKKSGYNPFTYRTRLDWNTVRIMQKYCSTVYQRLGLIEYANNSQFKNLNISAIKSSLPYPLQ